MSKKGIMTFGLAILLAAQAWGAMGSVVSSFHAPGNAVRGLARTSTRVVILIYGSPSRVYQVAPVTGSIYESWAITFGNNCRGLAFSPPNHLWVGNYGDDKVYDCRLSDGSVIRSWNAGHDPYGLAPNCTGDGGVGTTGLFSSDDTPPYCWLHATDTGSINSSFYIEKSNYFDIAWDHRNKLVWTAYPPDWIYGHTTAGSMVVSFRVPSTYPYGLTYSNEYLWVACATNGYVYRVHCPGTVGVSPASLGKVRALYR
jgi:hypothetical protein